MAKQKRRVDDERTKKRRQKRRQRFVFRWVAVLVVVALVVTVVRYWDKISPQNWVSGMSVGEGDGFPIDVSGSRIFQMETVENNVALLSDTHLVLYNNRGGEMMRCTHSYADPMLRAAGKYFLIVEKGGRRLQLETRSKTVITHTTKYDIITAAVHTNGDVAVVTAAEQGYNARLTVYRKDGTVVYERLCSTLISDVAFSPNGKSVAVAAISADKGAIRSSIEVLSLQSSESDPTYTYSANDVLLCRVVYLSGSLITGVSDTQVWMYHPQRDKCNTYTVTDGELTGFAIGNNSVALITQPYGSSGDGNFVYVKTDGSAAHVTAVPGVCRDVSAYRNTYAVLTDNNVYRLGGKGITDTKEVPSDGKMAARVGDTVVVLGLQSLTAY